MGTKTSNLVRAHEALSPQEVKFLTKCTRYFLSDRVTCDHKISQVEATNFLVNYSIHEAGICSGNPFERCSSFVFESTDVQLQMAFLNFVCPPIDLNLIGTLNYQGRLECLLRLRYQGREFGRILTGTESNWQFVTTSVEKYCQDLWAVGIDFHGGTFLPSQPISAISSDSIASSSTKYVEESITPKSAVSEQLAHPQGDQYNLHSTSLRGDTKHNNWDRQTFWHPVRVTGIILLSGLIMFLHFLKAARLHRKATGAADTSMNQSSYHHQGVDVILGDNREGRQHDETSSTASEFSLTIHLEECDPSRVSGTGSNFLEEHGEETERLRFWSYSSLSTTTTSSHREGTLSSSSTVPLTLV